MTNLAFFAKSRYAVRIHSAAHTEPIPGRVF
jgi:hypothetical protein